MCEVLKDEELYENNLSRTRGSLIEEKCDEC